MKRNFLIMLLMLIAWVPVCAQEYISHYECPEEDMPYELDGKKGIMLISRHNDLVIRPTNTVNPVEINQLGKRDDGFYIYEVIISPDDTPEPKLEISRRGSVYNDEIIVKKNKFKTDNFIAYKIEEVPNPIRSEDMTRGNDAVMKANETRVDITSSIKNLNVEFDPLLQARLDISVNKADPNIQIYSLTIPVKNYQNIKDRYTQLSEKLDSFKIVLNAAKELPEKFFEEMDSCEAHCKAAEADWNRVSSITVNGDQTNYVLLDISDLYPRKVKSFAVLPLVIEKNVFVTECSSFMSEAGKLFSQRKYKEAKAAYSSALNAKDVVVGMKPAIEESMAQCDSCIMYEGIVAFALKSIANMKKNGTATQEEIVKYATTAVDFLELLNKYNENEFYITRVNTMKGLIDKLPLKIKFTIVEWLTLNEGNAIPSVEVWAFNGDFVVTVNSFSSDKKFRRMINDEKDAYYQIGVSDANGKVEVELDRKNLPKGIIFRPTDNDDVKIKYMPFSSLMRQAHGTYVEKQFRLKMFKK